MASQISDDQDDEIISGINITPMVDVMLVLLVIFMVTANFIVRQAIEINVPETKTAASISTDKPFEVSLDSNGKLYLGEKEIDNPALQSEILAFKTANSKFPQVILSADKSLDYGLVVGLIDFVREQGVTEFSIHVKPK